MSISQKILFKCSKCIYREYRMIGDCRPDANELKPCPICNSIMKSIKKDEKSLMDNIIVTIGQIFGKNKI